MAILHIVIFKLKPEATPAQIASMKEAGHAMVGQIPGLRSFQMGPVLPSTAHRAQGFDMGLMTVMEDEASVLAYAPHPAHQVVHKIRESICTETIVYDMVID